MKKVFILLLSLFLLTGCSLFKSDAMEDIEVYTTIYPNSYLIKNLYGEHATINSIYPNGVDINNYELSDKKLNEYAKSDLFVFNSQDQDRIYAVNMINSDQNLKLIDSALGMNYTYSIEELWLNPYNYLMMAKNIKTALSEYITNPYLVEEINNNYETLQYELSKLDATYKETLSNANYNVIVTDNDLFKFLEKYNIEVISLEEKIISKTVKENDSLSEIAKEYDISVSDILTYNNRTNEQLTVGETIKIPVKVIDSSNLNKVKKLISEKEIKYIYSTNSTTNEIVTKLIADNKLDLITINSMYSVDGDINNNNENYLTVMNNNLDLLKKELNK